MPAASPSNKPDPAKRNNDDYNFARCICHNWIAYIPAFLTSNIDFGTTIQSVVGSLLVGDASNAHFLSPLDHDASRLSPFLRQ
ncbi:hypothetical protein DdX_01107 [Ditylenchus destructor]|uniref:Uncharacterized protein n=1 Tax=Ditylenchus destructor TaxID=166010 RepID=A0AAD4RAZ8_9BILA|nr:hypothetical protein DdX_01107 [Ditylenchus destructor]